MTGRTNADTQRRGYHQEPVTSTWAFCVDVAALAQMCIHVRWHVHACTHKGSRVPHVLRQCFCKTHFTRRYVSPTAAALITHMHITCFNPPARHPRALGKFPPSELAVASTIAHFSHQSGIKNNTLEGVIVSLASTITPIVSRLVEKNNTLEGVIVWVIVAY